MPHVPNIAGQQRGYLRRQLLIIRENAWGADSSDSERWRTHPIMERQAARISIEEVDALAQYYAALDCRGAPAQ
jgi:cytochrome c553